MSGRIFKTFFKTQTFSLHGEPRQKEEFSHVQLLKRGQLRAEGWEEQGCPGAREQAGQRVWGGFCWRNFSGRSGLEESRVEGLEVKEWAILESFRGEGIRWFDLRAEEDETCRSEEAGVAMRQALRAWMWCLPYGMSESHCSQPLASCLVVR